MKPPSWAGPSRASARFAYILLGEKGGRNNKKIERSEIFNKDFQKKGARAERRRRSGNKSQPPPPPGNRRRE